MSRSPITLLVAEDNPDDRLLVEEAWRMAGSVKLHIVKDGEELMDFLYHQGKYATIAASLTPGLILLDLNMPKKNGFEVLQELAESPDLNKIPVVVLTTSASTSDVNQSYSLGANSYVTKPDTFEELIELMRELHKYWFETVRLPD
jgi:CheY-like chemotaxis protein